MTGASDIQPAPLTVARQLHEAGRLHEAEAAYRRLLEHDPQSAKGRYLLGTLLHQTGRSEAAILELERACAQRSDMPAIYINLGAAYLQMGRTTEAIKACTRAVEMVPDNPDAHFNLGHGLLEIRDWAGATRAYENYIRLRPNDGKGYGALGDALKERGQFEAAMAAFETAMTLTPDHPGAYLGVADLLLRRGLSQAALTVMDGIAQNAARDATLQRRAAEMRLTLGQLAQGWDAYDDVRLLSIGAAPADAPPPHWKGEDLSGKTILIRAEQGIGDEVLFAGLIPEIAARAARLAIICSPRMTPILRRSFPAADVRNVPHDETFDFQVAAGSLGRYLRRSFESFPKHAGYLAADPEKCAALRRKYEDLAQGRRIVGIAWKSKHNVLGSSKSADLLNLHAILQTPGALFVNLQYGDCAAEIADVRAKLGVEIYQDAQIDSLTDMDGFFAQIAALDLVVTTSNSAAHIAGSLNIPTWLLLPQGRAALWYWFQHRADSPWYPSMRIIRGSGATPDQAWELDASARAGMDLAACARQSRPSG